MTKAQKVFKGIWYYILILSCIYWGIYIVGCVNAYFNGFTFIFSTSYGWEAVGDFAFLAGIVMLIIYFPFALYLLVELIYLKMHPVCRELRLKDYARIKTFYVPIPIAAGIAIMVFGGIAIRDAVDLFTPCDITSPMQNSLSCGVFFEIPYSEELAEYEEKVLIMDVDELGVLLQKNGDEYANALAEYFSNGYIAEKYVVMVLPAHTGYLRTCELEECTVNQGRRRFDYKFVATRDNYSGKVLSCYVVGDNIYMHYPDYDEYDKKDWKEVFKLTFK